MRRLFLLAFPAALLCWGTACNEPVTVTASCGNGVAEGGEGCDDGNVASGDGCSAACIPEHGGGVCGDGTVDRGEACDDGNTDSGDGCSSGCSVEGGCGDGSLVPPEECDDGNVASGDGCSSSCMIEARCGDGVVQAGELCDDGNELDTDGCVSCQLAACGDGHGQAGVESCDDGNRAGGDGCDALCHTEVCGNGVTQPSLGETCDDGNTLPSDGCGPTCRLERCGDAVLQPAAIDALEFIWLATACSPGGGTITFTIEGATVLERPLGSSCDCAAGVVSITVRDPAIVGLLRNAPGTAGVKVSAGSVLAWALIDVHAGELRSDMVVFDASGGGAASTRNPDICFAQQADVDVTGPVDPRLPEQCDDGNEDTTDGCPACVPAFCGDGYVRAGSESCDDGNDYGDDDCLPGCIPARCGDGILNVVGGEQCDDGGTDPDDGCGPTCNLEICGDGIVQGARIDSVDVTWLGTSCSAGSLVVRVNGVQILDAPSNALCDCIAPIQSTLDAPVSTITDPALLAAFTGRDAIEVQGLNDMILSWVVLTLHGPRGDNELEILDIDGGGDGLNRTPDLCLAGNQVQPLVSFPLQLANAEQCDDGNLDDTDACASCSQARCGDGLVFAGVEPCDDGNFDPFDDCLPGCVLPSCGDGFLRSGVEECDDGNLVPGDLCRPDCTLPVESSVFFDSFDGGDLGWVHYLISGGISDTWGLVPDPVSGASLAWSSGTTAPFEGDTRLESPSIDLSGVVAGDGVGVRFDHFWEFDDCGNPTFLADGGIVEISVDGAPFAQLDPQGGYPYVFPGACNNPLPVGIGLYSQNSGGQFLPAAFDLSPYAGHQVRIGFHVGWDCGNCNMAARGWAIDDFEIFTVR